MDNGLYDCLRTCGKDLKKTLTALIKSCELGGSRVSCGTVSVCVCLHLNMLTSLQKETRGTIKMRKLQFQQDFMLCPGCYEIACSLWKKRFCTRLAHSRYRLSQKKKMFWQRLQNSSKEFHNSKVNSIMGYNE